MGESEPLEPPSFKVIYSGQVRGEVDALAARARACGISTDFLNALKIIDANLHDSPTTFGDPYNHLPISNFTIYRRILSPLHVTYSVNEEKRLVFVRSFEPYPRDSY